MNARSFLLLAAICLVWALNTIVSKLAVSELALPPLFYATLRSVVVALALAPWLRPIPDRFLLVAAVALAVSGGSFALLFIGLTDASPSAAGIVSLTGAPLTVLFAIVLLREKVHWRRGLGIALTFLGVGIAVASPSGWQSSIGLLFVGASSVVGALGNVGLKRLSLEPLRMQAWAGAISAIVLLPLSLMLEDGQAAAVSAEPWGTLAAVLFSGLIVSIGAHTLYYGMITQHDVNLIAPLTLMTPVFTVLLGIWLTGDHVGPELIAGALVAAAGVLVIVLRPGRNYLKAMLVRTRL
ncbi:DMT family transporter [Croceicoccus sp. Ery15]|uniref:DMT family transporter n=1 Tax=Croceicoccus sp. Ery15 TaxID=1703338 RepID=UPI001E2877FB|nr:DMT family transporter [Croceicoccus sp. Ery15]